MILFPWNPQTVPHMVLEITSGCNIVCRGCYKDKGVGTASLDQVERDLDVAQAARRVHTVSIAGAEPTLHPKLPEIVGIVRRRGLRAALITNGLRLDNALLARLGDAGLDIVMTHVDEGQQRPDLPRNPTGEDVNALRLDITRRVADHGIDAGLCTTLYRETLPNLPALVRLILDTKHIGFLFATQYADVQAIVRGQPRNGVRTTNREVAHLLAEEFRLEPFADIDPKRPLHWMSYLVPVAYKKNAACGFLPLRAGPLDALLLSLPRWLTGRNIYYCPQHRGVTVIHMTLNRLAQGDFIGASKRLIDTASGTEFRVKRLVFDNGLELGSDGQIECLEFCPNATVRDGKLVPVCVADYTSSPCSPGT